MDLIDRMGVLTDEGCELRLYLSRMVDEMRAAQSTVPDEISQTLLEMQQINVIKREQAQGIMDIQLGEGDGMNSVLEMLNSRLTVPANTNDVRSNRPQSPLLGSIRYNRVQRSA